MSDTIYAPATAPGRAAVAVLRLSGPQTHAALKALAGGVPQPRQASLRRLRDASGETLDHALALWMPGPGSFTGEDCAELHLHGGLAVIEGVLRALTALGLRLAEPGEFTRRAFENGRMDLVQAEGVADLVDAETEAQRRQALDQLGGGLSTRHESWREALLDILAHLEAAIDFPDEDLPTDVAARARGPLMRLWREIAAASADRRGERVREGLRIALIGAPNAGKSTLLNALLGRDAAIVAPTPGTTRDVVEGRMILAGVPTVLADTAGLRRTDEAIEGEGVRRALRWAEQADLRLWVVDHSAAQIALPEIESVLRPGDFEVVNKCDLAPGPDALGRGIDLTRVHVCAEKGEIEPLREALIDWVSRTMAGREPPAATRERHRLLLTEAAGRLEAALRGVEPELMAEDVRLACRALERLAGRIDPEDILGRVFSTFCIGK